jgi:prevent-host-death family protein
MAMTALAMTKAREEFAETVNRVAYTKERILVEKHGKALVAVVPIEDLELLQALEDRIDLAEARAVLAEAKVKGTKSLKTLKEELGL